MEWQPIETAPKDWTGIWLLSESNIRLSHWVSSDYPGRDRRRAGWYYETHRFSGLVLTYEDALEDEPTHWFPFSDQPIPPLPDPLP